MNRFIDWLRPKNITADDVQIIDLLINIVIFLLVGSLIAFLFEVRSGFGNTTFVAGFAFLLMAIGLFFLYQGRLSFIKSLIPTIALSAGIALMFNGNGTNDIVILLLPLAIMLANLFLGTRIGLVFTAVSMIAAVTVHFLDLYRVFGEISPSPGPAEIFPLSIFIILLGGTQYAIMTRFNQNLDAVRENEHKLQKLANSLEEQVRIRTNALVTVQEIGRRLSNILDEKELVKSVVEEVQEAFDYYHVHIYLMDKDEKNLRMAGGTGEAGQKMLESGHSIPVGKGLVGRAAQTNNMVMVSDVKKAIGWLPNPLLPETKSELAVPISAQNTVFGVLDVQHNLANGLSSTDTDLIQSVANQVAIALQNAQIFEEAQQKASQEALINTIGQRIQNTDSIEKAMQIAVRELGQALGVERTTVYLKTAATEN